MRIPDTGYPGFRDGTRQSLYSLWISIDKCTLDHESIAVKVEAGIREIDNVCIFRANFLRHQVEQDRRIKSDNGIDIAAKQQRVPYSLLHRHDVDLVHCNIVDLENGRKQP